MGTSLGGLGYGALGPRLFFRVAAYVMAILALIYYLVDKNLEQLYPDQHAGENIPMAAATVDADRENAVDEDEQPAHKQATAAKVTIVDDEWDLNNKSAIEMPPVSAAAHAKRD